MVSGARVVRVLWVCVASPLLMGGGEHWGCIRVRSGVSNSAGRASSKRFLFLIMPKRRDWARSVSESISDFNRL